MTSLAVFDPTAVDDRAFEDLTVLFIDNFDSFTYNLVEYVSQYAETTVYRNTATLETIEAADPDAIIISPGPGHPKNDRDVGVTNAVLEHISPTVPTLGVCLGLEAAVYINGGRIVRAPEPVHGKVSTISHDGRGIFRGVDQSAAVGRYHSLIAEDIPPVFEVTARTEDEHELVMGIRHREQPLTCVQFHPESVLTGAGHDLIEHFLAVAVQFHRA